MNKKGLAVAVALLVGVGLMPSLRGVGSQARAEDMNKRYSVEFGTSATWKDRTRITGYLHNNSGHAVHHMRLVIQGLDAKGHVISELYSAVDDTIPTDGRAYFEAQVPSSPSYRVNVDPLESFRAS
jgi:hypothetical protein